MATGRVGQDLGQKMDKMLQLFGTVDERLKAIETKFEDLHMDMLNLKSTSQQQGQKVQELEKEVKESAKRSEKNTKECNLRITNLEDRQRRRNLRFRGFKRSFGEGKKLFEALIQWLGTFEVHLTDSDIERAHWAFGRRDFQGERDLIIAFVSERKADYIYKFLRSQTTLKCDEMEIRVLRDLSRQTLSERAALRPIAALLFKNDVRFTWAFPTAILVFRDQQIYRARSLEEGKKMLQKLGIQSEETEMAESSKTTTASRLLVEIPTSDSSGRNTPETEAELARLEAEAAAVRKKTRHQRAKKI